MPESSTQNFNHLKIHSQYSICEGAVKIDDLQEFSKSNKIKSLALCDTSNLCGALEFAEKISKVGRNQLSVLKLILNMVTVLVCCLYLRLMKKDIKE
jgi:DNA polymerase III alpha subunit